MGSESFYVILLPDGVTFQKTDHGIKFHGLSIKTAEDFVEKISTIKFPIQRKDDFPETLVLDNCIQIDLGLENQFLQEITLSACLCWYKDSIKIMYEVFDFLNKSLIPMRIFIHPDEVFSPNSFNDFDIRMRKRFDEKWNSFNEIFKHPPVKLLPHDFLEHYKGKDKFINKLKRVILQRKV